MTEAVKSMPGVVDRFSVTFAVPAKKPEKGYTGNELGTTIPIRVYVSTSFEVSGTRPLSYLAGLANSPEVSINGKPLEQHLSDAIAEGKNYQYAIVFLYGYDGKACADMIFYRGDWNKNMTADAINFDGMNYVSATVSGVFCEAEAIIIGKEAEARIGSDSRSEYFSTAPELPRIGKILRSMEVEWVKAQPDPAYTALHLR
jgi:hypothetical protein